jgi:hypothetical protein
MSGGDVYKKTIGILTSHFFPIVRRRRTLFLGFSMCYKVLPSTFT